VVVPVYQLGKFYMCCLYNIEIVSFRTAQSAVEILYLLALRYTGGISGSILIIWYCILPDRTVGGWDFILVCIALYWKYIRLQWLRPCGGWGGSCHPSPTCIVAGQAWGDANGPRKPRCGCWFPTPAVRWGLAMPGCHCMVGSARILLIQSCVSFPLPIWESQVFGIGVHLLSIHLLSVS